MSICNSLCPFLYLPTYSSGKRSVWYKAVTYSSKGQGERQVNHIIMSALCKCFKYLTLNDLKQRYSWHSVTTILVVPIIPKTEHHWLVAGAMKAKYCGIVSPYVLMTLMMEKNNVWPKYRHNPVSYIVLMCTHSQNTFSSDDFCEAAA